LKRSRTIPFRHVGINQDHIDTLAILPKQHQGVGPALGQEHLKPMMTQDGLQERPKIRLIVDNQYTGGMIRHDRSSN
jgi:hypothetical protein